MRKLIAPYENVFVVGSNAKKVKDFLGLSDAKKLTVASPEQLEAHQNLVFLSGNERTFQTYDLVVLLGTLDEAGDILKLLKEITPMCSRNTRVAVISFSKLRRGFVKKHTKSSSSLKSIDSEFNWLPGTEVSNILELVNFEVVRQVPEILIPYNLGSISRGLNRWLTPLPGFRHFAVAIVTIARLKTANPCTEQSRRPSLSIVVPARNETGNIHRILQEIPQMSTEQEIVFVEGNSTDDTWKTLEQSLKNLPPDFPYSTRLLKQPGTGKGDAVRIGFEKSTGEILMILDADLTVPPDELPTFYNALVDDRAEFANGSRLVYPQEKEAMRFLNYIANKLFGLWFTFVIGQPVRDTLCGTKVLWREDYKKIAANRAYFGETDPFGDFDLLFGSARLNLKIRDIPVHYKERTYGSTNISRFRHGLLLLQMSVLAARKLVFAPVNDNYT
jgi:hypothetical protein